MEFSLSLWWSNEILDNYTNQLFCIFSRKAICLVQKKLYKSLTAKKHHYAFNNQSEATDCISCDT